MSPIGTPVFARVSDVPRGCVPPPGPDVVVAPPMSLVVVAGGLVALSDVVLAAVVLAAVVLVVVVLVAVALVVVLAVEVVVVVEVEVWYEVGLVKIIAVVYLPTRVLCKPWRHWKVTSYCPAVIGPVP
jgi:hypothetical protein